MLLTTETQRHRDTQRNTLSLIYDQGGVKLFKGDCLEIMPRLPQVDMIMTDPPYGHKNNDGDLIRNRERALGVGGAKDRPSRPIANDGPEANSLFREFLQCAHDRLLPGCCCCCCCCGGGGPDPQFARWSLWMDEMLAFKQMVVWDKGPIGMGWHYRRSYETVLVAQRKGAACRWYDRSHRVENVIRQIRKIIPAATQHPTTKPIALMEHFIRLHTRKGDTVLDPFAGSGTTLIAAANLGRKAVGIELSRRWCDLAVRRMRKEISA